MSEEQVDGILGQPIKRGRGWGTLRGGSHAPIALTNHYAGVGGATVEIQFYLHKVHGKRWVEPVPAGPGEPKVRAILCGHADSVTTVMFSPDGKTLASDGGDNSIKLWDVSTGQERATLGGHAKAIQGMVFTPDGTTLASGGEDGLRLWDVMTGKQLAALDDQAGGVVALAVSPDGKLLASADREKAIRLWNLASRETTAVLKGRGDEIAFSPDGTRLASTSLRDETTCLWDMAAGKNVAKVQGYGVLFSADGKTLVTACGDKAVRLWDVPTGKERAALPAVRLPWVSISPDGRTLAVWADHGDPRVIRLWDVALAKEVGSLPKSNEVVHAVVFSPDSKSLAMGDDSRIVLWDVSTWRRWAACQGHTDDVCCVAFSPDGKVLASGSHDNTVRLWDLPAAR
jgi:WD40 repeat protein